MKRSPRFAVGLVLLAAACSDKAGTPLDPSAGIAPAAGAAAVTIDADDGPGSFRAAIHDANADPSIGVIRFAPGLDPVVLRSLANPEKQPPAL